MDRLHQYEPRLHPVEIKSLRPTQMTVGFREVERKRQEWRGRADTNGPDYLGRHMVPVVIGPKNVPYLVDHHHLVRALHEEGVEHVLTSTVAELAGLEKEEFWSFLDHRNWVYPYDAAGKRQTYRDIPKTIGELADDPYRSLAGELREAGGYAKDILPYAEFQWADFLRIRIGRRTLRDDFKAALAEAKKLAHGPTAQHLPGWCGPSAKNSSS